MHVFPSQVNALEREKKLEKKKNGHKNRQYPPPYLQNISVTKDVSHVYSASCAKFTLKVKSYCCFMWMLGGRNRHIVNNIVGLWIKLTCLSTWWKYPR